MERVRFVNNKLKYKVKPMAPYCLGGNVYRLRARGGRGMIGLFAYDVTSGAWERELKVRFVYV